jgi:hypothetical protein
MAILSNRSDQVRRLTVAACVVLLSLIAANAPAEATVFRQQLWSGTLSETTVLSTSQKQPAEVALAYGVLKGTETTTDRVTESLTIQVDHGQATGTFSYNGAVVERTSVQGKVGCRRLGWKRVTHAQTSTQTVTRAYKGSGRVSFGVGGAGAQDGSYTISAAAPTGKGTVTMTTNSHVDDACSGPSSTPDKKSSQSYPDTLGGFSISAVGHLERNRTHQYPSLDSMRVLTGKVITYLPADHGTNIQTQQWSLTRTSAPNS